VDLRRYRGPRQCVLLVSGVLKSPGIRKVRSTPSLVSKVKTLQSQEDLVALLVSYVDDLRVASHDKADCWKVMHHVSSWLSYLGLQFATRKARPPSPTPGPWAGSVVHTSVTELTVSCTLEKWIKAKNIIHLLQETVGKGEFLSHKGLERDQVFLVHVTHISGYNSLPEGLSPDD
jgi:hypothetical protein